jgi:hypothetical protein
MLTHQIKSIDLLTVVTREGLQLNGRGKYHTGLCPFHAEKTPSFVINTEKNRFNCYGCNEHGDPVDFVRKLHGFSFPDALSYLCIENRPATKEQFREMKKRIREAEKRRERQEARQRRERELAFTLGTLIRWTHLAMRALTPANLHEYGGILQPLELYKWGHDSLINGDKLDRAYVLWSFKSFPTIERGQLFREDFDFIAWLRGFLKNGATSNVQTKEAG